MKKGWIKLHRKTSELEWWRKQRFTWGQAWIDLLLMVNHKSKKIVLDNEFYKIPIGSFVTSQRKLAKRWHWGIARVNFFLSFLQKTERSVEYKTEHNFTHIYILGWKKYQVGAEHKAEHKAELERNTSGTCAETNEEEYISKYIKNDKNINIHAREKNSRENKKIKKVKIYKRLPLEKQQTVHRLVYHLEDLLNTKIVNWGKQAKALKQMLKAGYTEKQIKKIITYMAKGDDYFSDKGFDLMTVANQIPRYKAEAKRR